MQYTVRSIRDKSIVSTRTYPSRLAQRDRDKRIHTVYKA